MRVGSDTYKIVTGKRDIIFLALYKAVAATRKQLVGAEQRLKNRENSTDASRDDRNRLYLDDVAKERLERYETLKTMLCRTHWFKLLNSNYQDWIEDLLEHILGWRYQDDEFVPIGVQMPLKYNYDAWDRAWVEVNEFIRLLLANSVQIARSLEIAAWLLSPEPVKRLRPLEYHPQISPNAPAL